MTPILKQFSIIAAFEGIRIKIIAPAWADEEKADCYNKSGEGGDRKACVEYGLEWINKCGESS